KTRKRERALLDACLASGQPCVIDNTNVRPSERAVYITAAKRAGFRVAGYFIESPLADALRRNAQRTGDGVIPVPGVIGTLKRLELPSLAEGFDELFLVTHGENNAFVVNLWPTPVTADASRHRIFLLSPANMGGERGRLLLRDSSTFDLAVRLRTSG